MVLQVNSERFKEIRFFQKSDFWLQRDFSKLQRNQSRPNLKVWTPKSAKICASVLKLITIACQLS